MRFRLSSELRRQFDAFSNGKHSKATSKGSRYEDVHFFTTLDFFEWTNAHSVSVECERLPQSTNGSYTVTLDPRQVVKLQKPKSGEDPWANLTHQWKARTSVFELELSRACVYMDTYSHRLFVKKIK